MTNNEFIDYQGQLFRNTDPDTSRRGARDVASRARSHRMRALGAIVHAHRGLTYAEVETVTGIRGIWKRLSELKHDGWIEVVGERLVPETGSRASVYRATSRALAAYGPQWPR